MKKSNGGGLVQKLKSSIANKKIDVEWNYKPLGKPVDLLNLDQKSCRFPCNNGLYCGALVSKRGMCLEHYKICWSGK